MTRLELDGDIESRINDLIDRGLDAYQAGDVYRALGFWRHALALDPDSAVAERYVAYVKRHFEIADELPASDAVCAADSELEVPFGLVLMQPKEPFDFEAYERLAAATPPSPVAYDEGRELARPKAAQADPLGEIDDGWSSSSGEFEVAELVKQRAREPVPRPTYDVSQLSMIDDIETGNLADALEPENLADQLAAVTEGLLIAESGAIETPPDPPPEPELDGPAPELVAAIAGKDRKATVYGYQPTIKPSTATLHGMPELGAQPGYSLGEPEASPLELEAQPLERDMFAQPGEQAPSLGVDAELELDVDNTPETADIPAPPPLADDLELELELEIDTGSSDLPDLTLDLGPAPAVEATPPPSELGLPGGGNRPTAADDILGFELELGSPGSAAPLSADVQISFHNLDRAGGLPGPPMPDQDIPLGLDSGEDLELQIGSPDPLATSNVPFGQVSTKLEDQLAELEVEMQTGAESFEWQAHDADRRGTLDTLRAAAPVFAGSDLGSIADQIRAAIDQRAVPGESPIESMRRRIAGYIERAAVESRAGNLSVAAVAADLALSEDPDSATAQKLIHQSHAVLVEVFRSYLGSLDGVPAISLPMHEIPMQELDHRTAFLLSRIDGTLSFEDILDVSGMPRLEALRYLCRLRLQGILEVR